MPVDTSAGDVSVWSGDERFELAALERGAGLDQRAPVVDLAPDVPEQEAARPASLVDVADDALPVRLGPGSLRLEARVDVPHRLVAELEEIRVEERQVRVRRVRARHVRADRAAVAVRVILVLDADARPERLRRAACD